MSWGWFALMLVALVGCAVIFEAFIWRGIKRPLSRHAVYSGREDHLKKRNSFPLGIEETNFSEFQKMLRKNARVADQVDAAWRWKREKH